MLNIESVLLLCNEGALRKVSASLKTKNISVEKMNSCMIMVMMWLHSLNINPTSHPWNSLKKTQNSELVYWQNWQKQLNVKTHVPINSHTNKNIVACHLPWGSKLWWREDMSGGLVEHEKICTVAEAITIRVPQAVLTYFTRFCPSNTTHNPIPAYMSIPNNSFGGPRQYVN